ncbi:replication protein [Aeromonas caviae]|uniref:replication protein n=1 Tax=Aeromonas caviae TaxID=648 RepID=UPI0038D24417
MAELEKGFLRLASELVDEIAHARYDISKLEFRILMVVSRKTYGFNKKLDWISGAQFAEATGMTENKARDVVRALVERKILLKEGRKIGWNTAISEWQIKQPQNRVNNPKIGSLNNPKTGLRTTPKQGHTKDTIQKTVKTTTDGASACAEPPAVIPEKRPGKNTPYQAILDAYHEVLPEMPAIRELTDSRKTKIRNFWTKFKFDETRWRAYLDFIAKNCRWMCESRPRRDGESAWKPKNLDFLVTERCYLGVREGRFNDE